MSAPDAILFVSFGGPESPSEVMPFLRNVTSGRNVPDERLQAVAKQYELFGGRSPINDQTRALIEATRSVLKSDGIELPIYWGCRNWNPLLSETMKQMKADGCSNVVAFVTSAYSSYSSCRQYREDIAAAQLEAGPDAPQVRKIGQFYDHSGFVDPFVRNAREALEKFDDEPVSLVFTAHSIPVSMAKSSRYESQLLETASRISAELGMESDWALVFQSRSGSPHTPWLEPDVNSHLRSLSKEGVRNVVVLPIGFISDHMEVLFDLNTQARQTADELGIRIERIATPGTDPQFVAMVAELVSREIRGEVTSRCLGETCCLA